MGQGTKSPFLHMKELFIAFQATRMTDGLYCACSSLQHLLLQTFAALGSQPKALQEAIVLRFCSFIVQMKCAPQLKSAQGYSVRVMSIWLMQDATRSSQPVFSLQRVHQRVGTRCHFDMYATCSIPSYYVLQTKSTDWNSRPFSVPHMHSQTCILGPQTGSFIH